MLDVLAFFGLTYTTSALLKYLVISIKSGLDFVWVEKDKDGGKKVVIHFIYTAIVAFELWIFLISLDRVLWIAEGWFIE